MMFFKSITNVRCSCRFYSSALYITGDKAQKTYAVLNPVIDFDERLRNKNNLVENVTARGLSVNIDGIVKKWSFFRNLVHRKETLENNRQVLAQNIQHLSKKSEVNESEIEKLKLQARLLKQELKTLKESIIGVEESVMLQILDLPNVLHEKTPLNEEITVTTKYDLIKDKTVSNLVIGTENNYVKYLDTFSCFLKNDAALLELRLTDLVRKMLLNFGYRQFSNPNFIRSVIVEGCSEPPQEVFTIQERDIDERNLNKLHLCGSSSLDAFMAYFTRHGVHSTILPLKLLNIGRFYRPVDPDIAPSLFNLCQQSVVSVFRADLEDSVEDLDEFVDLIDRIYGVLGLHYRLVLLPAGKLRKAESLRLSVQMYSNCGQEYVEVGFVAFYGSFLSKRLLFTYGFDKGKRYPRIVFGQIVNYHKVLGCLLENRVAQDGLVNLKDMLDKIKNVL